MCAKFRIKRDDQVVVIAGKDKGVVGQVLRVIPKEGRVVVSGVNVISRHVKPSAADPDGGVKKFEKSIHLSNVQIVDPVSNKPSRIGYKFLEDKKVRFLKSSGEVLER